MSVKIRKLVKISPRFSDKEQAVSDYFSWNFIREIGKTVTIVSAVVTVTVLDGVDADPDNILSGSAIVEPDGKSVRHLIQGGVPGVLYQLTCTATTDEVTDNEYPFETQLKVIA